MFGWRSLDIRAQRSSSGRWEGKFAQCRLMAKAWTLSAALLDQAVLCDFIQEGHLGRHLRRMRELYAERLGVLIESARENLAGLLEISSVEAGLQTVGWLAGGINAERAARKAAQLDVEVIPLSRYTSRAFGREGLILGFAAVDARELRRGTEQLARALQGG